MPRLRQPVVHHAVLLALAGLACVAVPESAAVNYVPNPGFETCTASPASWAAVATELVGCDAAMPGAGSYSMAVQNDGSATLVRAQSDCVVISGGTSIPTFRFSYRTASSAVVQATFTANAYTANDCTGNNGVVSAGVGASFVTPIATDGVWHTPPTVSALVDGATHSIRFFATFQLNSATDATVYFDDFEFSSAAGTTTSTSTSTSTTGAAVTSTTGSAATSTTSATATSTTSAPPTTLPVSFSGTGPAASDCYVTFQGFAADAQGRADCTDGASCDADGAANGSCTFAVRVCVAQPLAGCTAATVTSLKATPAIALPPVPAAAPACGATTQIVVPLKRNGRRPGLKRLAFTAKSDGKPKRERDVIKLRCLPPA